MNLIFFKFVCYVMQMTSKTALIKYSINIGEKRKKNAFKQKYIVTRNYSYFKTE